MSEIKGMLTKLDVAGTALRSFRPFVAPTRENDLEIRSTIIHGLSAMSSVLLIYLILLCRNLFQHVPRVLTHASIRVQLDGFVVMFNRLFGMA